MRVSLASLAVIAAIAVVAFAQDTDPDYVPGGGDWEQVTLTGAIEPRLDHQASMIVRPGGNGWGTVAWVGGISDVCYRGMLRCLIAVFILSVEISSPSPSRWREYHMFCLLDC